jgi:hypothetical protein
MLGSFPSVDKLLAAVRNNVAAIQRNPAARPPGGGGLPLCAVVADLFYGAKAVVAGKPVTVVVFGHPGTQQVEVDDSRCTPVFTGHL